MIISILHISDLHIIEEENHLFKKEEFFFNSVKNDISKCKYLFVVVSGDIVNRGKKSEFDNFGDFIKRFEDKLLDYISGLKIEYIFAPGNHDCDFSDQDQNELRDILIDKILNNPKDTTINIVNNCSKVQHAYFNHIKSYDSYKKVDTSLSNELYTRYEYRLGEHSISFGSFNFSYISKIKEDQAKIVYPLHLIDTDQISTKKCDINISLFHHPLHWLKHQSKREFIEFLEATSNIVLSGHEHTASAHNYKNIYTKNHIEYIEAGSLQNLKDEEDSKFNLLILDLESKGQDILSFSWNGSFYEKERKQELDLPINNKSIFTFTLDYKDKLTQYGIKLQHPRVERVNLEDVFIYPDLKKINSGSSQTGNGTISSKDLLTQPYIGHNIIYGSDNSGKTALCYKYQLKSKREGLIPIYINGTSIKQNDITSNRIDAIIKRSFKSQYETDKRNFELLSQQNINDMILIFDDFDSVKMNNEYKSKFINELVNMNYSNVIIFANDSMMFEATTESLLAKELDEFTHYSLRKFGHKLRDKMITKWIRLGQESEIENKELSTKRREKANAINQTIGLNFVPSYPLYLLMLLQSMELNEQHSLDKSAYGNYYHYLIMKYLNQDSTLENKDINTIFTYTATLAFKMFDEKQHEFLESELIQFDSDYKIQKDFTPTFNIIDKLVNSNLLQKQEDKYKFSQKYIYYYFVAHFFSQNIDKSEYTDIIEKMTQRLYRVEFANILMFVFHFSPKEHIIKMLQNEASEIFSEISEFRFANDELININASIKEDTTHKLTKRTIDEAREKELEEQEVREKNDRKFHVDDHYDADYNEDIPALDFYKKINLAFKLIEILGEIVKNYAGSLDGPITYKLVQDTYGMGLRSLKCIIQIFENEHDLLIKHITEHLSKKHYVTEDKISEEVSKMVFKLALAISSDIVKRIAKSVGTKDLKKTYKKIIDSDIDNIAYELIGVAIDLDFTGGLNENKIIQLHKKFDKKKSRLPHSALKKFVLDHLYMFEISYDKKASICKRLDIGMESSKKALISSKQ